MTTIVRRVVSVCVLSMVFGAGAGVAQIPDEFTNLQVLAEDTPRDSLIQVMRGFSLSLGVRCQYCHVGGNGVSFEGVDFASDDDEDKRKARYMLRLVDDMNGEILPAMADRDVPSVRMECKTCHRGVAKPRLLGQELRLALDDDGLDAAVRRYRSLRERYLTSGTYDFGEWETNLLAERLAAEGCTDQAVGIYELNAEFHPESVSIQMSLGGLYEGQDDREGAIRAYRRALELNPELESARERLSALGAEPVGSG